MSFAEKIERPHKFGKAVSEVAIDGSAIGLNPIHVSIPRDGKPTAHLEIRNSKGRRDLRGEIVVITVVDPKGFTEEDNALLAIEASLTAWARIKDLPGRRKALLILAESPTLLRVGVNACPERSNLSCEAEANLS